MSEFHLDKYEEIRSKVSETLLSINRKEGDALILGVTKRKSPEAILDGYKAGLKHFGESYVQEFIDKYNTLASAEDFKPIWHFIGHLQKNKVKYIIDKVEYIHSVEKFSLAKEINKQAKKIDKIQKILVQVKLGEESTKSGIMEEEIGALLKEIESLEYVKLVGFMGLPPYFANPEEVRPYFKKLASLAKGYFLEKPHLLSMGMSHDYIVALEEGAHIIRIGTALFGHRD